jgi:chloramphenicol-sensitive protein RarD
MQKKGIAFALGAYILWGLFPIYWKWLHDVNPVEVIGHRIVWSFLILLTFILATRQFKTFRQKAFKPRVFWLYILAAVLIAFNWLVYVWAVNADFIVDASLGYYINPLLSVLLGVIFLRERLRPFQWIPVILATAGVIYLTVAYGRLPWIALTLAFTFSIYGWIKKIAPLGSLYGLTLETGILSLPAVAFLTLTGISEKGAFLRLGLTTDMLLVGAGIITSCTLMMFASAAQCLPLTILGILEYIAPTIAFLLGVLVYEEPFDNTRLIGFGIVWIALVLFTGEGLWRRHKLDSTILRPISQK